MTQNEKDLLLKDLCCRLPYGVVIQDKCLVHDDSFLPNKEDDTPIDIDVYSGILMTNGGSFYEVDEMKSEGTLCNMEWGFESFKECEKAAVKEVLECWL